MEETFTYDNIDRLTGITLKGGPYSEMVYDKLGRMVKKQMDGKTVFEEAAFRADKPHAIATATADPGLFDTKQEIKYTSFDKVSAISQSVGTVSYTYGYDEQRLTMREETDAVKRTKTYVGACEFITANGREKVLTYLTGPYGVFAVVEKVNGKENIHYIHKDHLGSWTTITDEKGKVEQRQSFDAWGNRRNATTWFGAATDEPMFDRGYTGHEHLYAFGLINMNGRVYDPTTSSFLSPDNYVQDPTSQQGFNRYAYCFYNPLKYVDPSGYLCDGPPHVSEVTLYLMCMDPYNAQKLNELGIEWIEVAHVIGSSDYTVRWVEGNNEYSMDYSGYMDSGYHGDYGWYNPCPDGALPVPPVPMFYNDSYQGNCGIPVDGGNGGSGGGSSSSNNSHLKHAIGSAVAGRYLSHNEKKYYNKETRTWTGKNGKQYGFKFKGNRYTGGIYKFGRLMSRLFKGCNYGLALAYSGYTYDQYTNGCIDEYELWSEEISNILSVAGVHGLAWNIGWELGRLITETHQYQEFKYNLLYDMEVRRIGEPCESNEHLWKEWYDYYEKHK